jgi:hypothetical protein
MRAGAMVTSGAAESGLVSSLSEEAQEHTRAVHRRKNKMADILRRFMNL